MMAAISFDSPSRRHRGLITYHSRQRNVEKLLSMRTWYPDRRRTGTLPVETLFGACPVD
jgi:hypothetical protein